MENLLKVQENVSSSCNVKTMQEYSSKDSGTVLGATGNAAVTVTEIRKATHH